MTHMHFTPYNLFGGVCDDILALSVTVGGAMHFLPEFVMVLGAAWYIINIWEWWKDTRRQKAIKNEEGPELWNG